MHTEYSVHITTLQLADFLCHGLPELPPLVSSSYEEAMLVIELIIELTMKKLRNKLRNDSLISVKQTWNLNIGYDSLVLFNIP